MTISLKDIAERIGAPLRGGADISISRVAPLGDASAQELAFAESKAYEDAARISQCCALIVGHDFSQIPEKILLRVAHPRLALISVLEMFAPEKKHEGIHRRASIAKSVVLGERVTIGACAVIEARTIIGSGTRIGPGAYIGSDVTVGGDCTIGPNASVLSRVTLGNRVVVHAGTVIGGDGFGYHWSEDHHHKIPHLGTVVIEDDVEIGCNCCIDRATLGATRIRRGTKIDNLVQIAHNSDVGEHVILTGQVGLAGGVTLGTGVMIGGQTAVSDHVSVGAGARVGGGSGVTKDVAAGETVWGTPARPIAKIKRQLAALAGLPKLRKQVQEQEAKLRHLATLLQEMGGHQGKV